MTWFLLSFFLIYGLMHGYAFFKVRAAVHLGSTGGILLALWMLLMILAPVGIRILEYQGHEKPAMVLSWVAYLWLGFLFLFMVCALMVDLLRFFGVTAAWLTKQRFPAFAPGVKAAFFLPLVLSLAATVYGYYEALHIRTERVVIETDKLPAGMERFRICQISDVHLGLIVRERRLAIMLDIVKRENPDLLVSTGDLVDGQLDHLSSLADPLREVRPAGGKFAVTGNHEFIAGIEKSLAFTSDAGFNVLRGEARDVGGFLTIAGVDDPAGQGFRLMGKENGEGELLASLPRDRFILFLKHRPTLEVTTRGFFDLQLSGHTHRGQIFPFNWIVGLYFPLGSGLHDLGGSLVYVSRGSGTWGPPIRFLAPPEVTVIDLVRRKSGSPKRGNADG
ncbi:MAG TPA: metallophosphoesterase [Syntrophales bacterium]|nr:metallophosphoesterase [Syntrophales bacterium]